MVNVFQNTTPCLLVENTPIFSHSHKNLKSKIHVLFYFLIFYIYFPLATSFAHSLPFYLLPYLLLLFYSLLLFFSISFNFCSSLVIPALPFSVFSTHVLCY